MKAHSYIIDDISIHANDVIILNLVDKKEGLVFDFKPGQYAMLIIRNEKGKLTNEHAFSIASAPTEKKYLQFGIKIIGDFTKRLSKMTKGSEVYVYGPYGDFTFDPNRHKDAVYIAGGMGITPFMSVFRYAADMGLSNKLILLDSTRTINGTLYYDEIRNLEEKNQNFKAFFAVTDEDISADVPRAKKCFIDAKMILESSDGNIGGKYFFICGPPGFMNAMINCLKGLGVSREKIRTEKFAMNPSFKDSLRSLGFKLIFGGSIAIFFLALLSVYDNEQDKIATRRANNNLESQRQTFKDWINNLEKGATNVTQPTGQQSGPTQTKLPAVNYKLPTIESKATTPTPVVTPTPTPTPAPQPAPIYIPPRTTIS